MKDNSIILTQSYKKQIPFSEKLSHYKPYEDLSLMDSFLFETATENPENAITIAKPIIERATGKKVKKLVVHPQKDLKGININTHGIPVNPTNVFPTCSPFGCCLMTHLEITECSIL